MPGDGRRGSRPERVRVVPGLHPVRELLLTGGRVHAVHVSSGRRDGGVLAEIRELAGAAGVPLRELAGADLDQLAAGVAHQGVVATAPPYRYRDVGDLLTGEGPTLLMALDGVTDPHNLGSIARTAEAVGAHGVVVAARRAVGVTPAAEKAAAGALSHLPVARVPNLVRALEELSARGVWSVGLDADADLDARACALLGGPVVVVVGAEGRGLSRLVRERCDQLVALPMRGAVASLNASVAAGVVLYTARWTRDTA